MRRIVPDINTMISGLLWTGAPAQVLQRAADGSIDLFSSHPILTHLLEVLSRPKLRNRLAELEWTPHDALDRVRHW